MSEELGLDPDELTLVEQVDLDLLQDEKLRSEAIKEVLRTRKVAYGRVFVDGNSTEADRKTVLEDIQNFCRKKRSTFHPNVQVAARLDGRREVSLRIDEYLELTVDELVQRRA